MGLKAQGKALDEAGKPVHFDHAYRVDPEQLPDVFDHAAQVGAIVRLVGSAGASGMQSKPGPNELESLGKRGAFLVNMNTRRRNYSFEVDGGFRVGPARSFAEAIESHGSAFPDGPTDLSAKVLASIGSGAVTDDMSGAHRDLMRVTFMDALGRIHEERYPEPTDYYDHSPFNLGREGHDYLDSSSGFGHPMGVVIEGDYRRRTPISSQMRFVLAFRRLPGEDPFEVQRACLESVREANYNARMHRGSSRVEVACMEKMGEQALLLTQAAGRGIEGMPEGTQNAVMMDLIVRGGAQLDEYEMFREAQRWGMIPDGFSMLSRDTSSRQVILGDPVQMNLARLMGPTLAREHISVERPFSVSADNSHAAWSSSMVEYGMKLYALEMRTLERIHEKGDDGIVVEYGHLNRADEHLRLVTGNKDIFDEHAATMAELDEWTLDREIQYLKAKIEIDFDKTNLSPRERFALEQRIDRMKARWRGEKPIPGKASKLRQLARGMSMARYIQLVTLTEKYDPAGTFIHNQYWMWPGFKEMVEANSFNSVLHEAAK